MYATPKLLRQIQTAASAIALANMFLTITLLRMSTGDISKDNMDGLLVIPQVVVHIALVFYYQLKRLLVDNFYVHLVISVLVAGAYLFFAGKVFPLALHVNGLDLMLVIEVINVILTILVLTELGLTIRYKRKDEARRRERQRAREERSENNLPTVDTEETGSEGTAPTQTVHLYQPALLLTPSSPSSAATAQPLEGESTRIYVEDEVDGFELEELPKYQRRAPAQTVTIVDMSNLEAVSPEILSRIQQQGGDVDQEETTEAPSYSPSPSLPPSGTQLPPPSPTQLPAANTSETEAITVSPLLLESRSGPTSEPVSNPSSEPTPPMNEPPVYMP